MNLDCKVQEYMHKRYPMVLIPEAWRRGYVVAFPDLPGCLSFGKDIEECMAMGYDARRVWLESMLEDGQRINEPGTVDMRGFLERAGVNKGYIVQSI